VDEDHHESHAHESQAAQKAEADEIHFKPVEVVPGTTDLGYTAVQFTQKTAPTAMIVTKGAFYLLSVMKGGGAHAH
jgi:cobalt-zinc-cadmium efflux system membrane fusion protein